MFVGNTPNLTPKGSQYMADYSARSMRILNDFRNNVVNSLKEEAFKYMQASGKYELPGIEEFLKILRRDEDLDRELFKWYWTDLMPKAAGLAKIWSNEIKFYR